MSEPAHMRKEAIASPVAARPRRTPMPPSRTSNTFAAPRSPAWPPARRPTRWAAPRHRATSPPPCAAGRARDRACPPISRRTSARGSAPTCPSVRVHADSEADAISRSVQAAAFTHGERRLLLLGRVPAGQQGRPAAARTRTRARRPGARRRPGPAARRSSDGPTTLPKRLPTASPTRSPRRNRPDPPISRSVAGVPAEVRRCRDAAVIHRSLLSKLKELLGIAAPAPQPVMAQPAPPAAANWAPARPKGAAKKNGPQAGTARKAGWQQGAPAAPRSRAAHNWAEPGRRAAAIRRIHRPAPQEERVERGRIRRRRRNRWATRNTPAKSRKPSGTANRSSTSPANKKPKKTRPARTPRPTATSKTSKSAKAPATTPTANPISTSSGEQEAKEDEGRENAPSDGYVEDLKIGNGPKARPLQRTDPQPPPANKSRRKTRAARRSAPTTTSRYSRKRRRRKRRRSDRRRRELPVVVEEAEGQAQLQLRPRPCPAGDRATRRARARKARAASSAARRRCRRPSRRAAKGAGDSRPHRAFQMVKLPERVQRRDQVGEVGHGAGDPRGPEDHQDALAGLQQARCAHRRRDRRAQEAAAA